MTDIEIFDDIEQGGEQWHRIRMGVPTCSDLKKVLAKGKDGGGTATSVTRSDYMEDLATEIVTGEPREHWLGNGYTENGKLREPEARELYSIAYRVEPRQVGFVLNRELNFGYSPDAMIGDKGRLEIKVSKRLVLAAIKADAPSSGWFPAEHRLQCQGGLWASDGGWIDLALYWPGLPFVVLRAYRDEACIAEIAEGVRKFNAELYDLVMKIRSYGEPTPAEPDVSGSLLMAG